MAISEGHPIVTLLVMLLGLSCSSANDRAYLRVYVVGDCLTRGYAMSPSQAFPAVLQSMVDADRIPARIENFGTNIGETTTSALLRMDWILKSKPDMVVLALGANDMVFGTPAPVIEKNLRSLIKTVSDSGAHPVLFGVTAYKTLGPIYVQEFNSLYPRIARDTSVPYFPYFNEGIAGHHDMNQVDGAHPTPEANRIMSRRIYPFLKRQMLRILQSRSRGTENQ